VASVQEKNFRHRIDILVVGVALCLKQHPQDFIMASAFTEHANSPSPRMTGEDGLNLAPEYRCEYAGPTPFRSG
jgi:hypothetical protein